MLRRRACIVTAALGLALALVAPSVASVASADTISASISGTPSGQPLASGFLGVSLEYRALHQYTGRDPTAVDPVLVNLLRALSPGGATSIRVGGDSADGSWWPVHGVVAPGGIYYGLTDGWLRSAQALAADVQTKLILDIDLAAGRPQLAAAEGRAFFNGIGRRYIQAFEIGNEPDLYGIFPWYKDRRGHLHWSRTRRYSLANYTSEFNRFSRALPGGVPLAGPAASGAPWMNHLGRFIGQASRRLGMITYHRYPLRACVTDSHQPSYPTIANLLADGSSTGLANGLASYVRTAHSHHLSFRLSEINTASCQGEAGVSDSFASALWALDTMFNLAATGVDGVNFHMLPGSHYELFTPAQTPSGSWQAFVHPEYYGLLMFAQAFPIGARLLPVTAPGGAVKVWATQATDGSVRVTLINQDPGSDHTVAFALPGSPASATEETLTAPSLSSTTGVSLGGQTFGDETPTGTLPGTPSTSTVTPSGATYSIDVPAGSAALISTGPIAGAGGVAGTLTVRPR